MRYLSTIKPISINHAGASCYPNRFDLSPVVELPGANSRALWHSPTAWVQRSRCGWSCSFSQPEQHGISDAPSVIQEKTGGKFDSDRKHGEKWWIDVDS
jgi:hypothetical protein